MMPKECPGCGWMAKPSEDLGRTVVYTCERCGQSWRVEKPMQHQILQSRLEGFR